MRLAPPFQTVHGFSIHDLNQMQYSIIIIIIIYIYPKPHARKSKYSVLITPNATQYNTLAVAYTVKSGYTPYATRSYNLYGIGPMVWEMSLEVLVDGQTDRRRTLDEKSSLAKKQIGHLVNITGLVKIQYIYCEQALILDLFSS